MKKLFPIILLIAGLTATLATAQTRMRAKQVSVSTNNWTELAPTKDTVQSVFDYIDAEGLGTDNLTGGYGTNTFVNTNTWQQILQTPSVSTGVVAGGFYLPGTNIVGATYDSSNQQWTVDTSELLPGTNIVGATYNSTNLEWTVDTPQALTDVISSLSNLSSSALFTFISTNSPIVYTNLTPGSIDEIDKMYDSAYSANSTFKRSGFFGDYSQNQVFVPLANTNAYIRGGLWLPEIGNYLVSASFGLSPTLFAPNPYSIFVQQRDSSGANVSRYQALTYGGDNSGSSVGYYSATTTNEYVFFSFAPVTANAAFEWLSLTVVYLGE